MVCQKYSPPDGYIPNMSNPLLDHKYGKWVAPVLATAVLYTIDSACFACTGLVGGITKETCARLLVGEVTSLLATVTITVCVGSY